MAYGRQKHWLLDRRAGWRPIKLEGVTLHGNEGTLRLQPVPGAACPLVDAAGSFGGLVLPTGLAVDADGRIYISDGGAHLIRRFDPCTETFEPLSCIGGPGGAPRQLCDPKGLAVSCRGDLYVADSGNRRVQVFALKGLPLRAIWEPLQVIRTGPWIRVRPAAAVANPPDASADCDPAAPMFPEGTWQPWDILIARDNRIYVSDYANGLIHAFDSCGCWRRAYTGEGPGAPPLVKPTHMALDSAGRFYILQEGVDYVTVLDYDGEFLERIERPEQVEGRFEPIAIAVDRDGILYIAERFTHRLHLYCKDAEGRYTCVSPCGSFEGVAAALAFDLDGNPLLGDEGQRQVVCLKAQGAYEMGGVFCSEPLDSRTYRCQWHRVSMRVRVEPGTQVRVDTFTSESYKSAAEIQNLSISRWVTGQIHTQVGEGEWDCLIDSPPGRYLWLRLTLKGNGKATPVIHEVKVFYPRASSLQFLPAVYQEDAVSASFMDRYLSIFDTIVGGISDRIANIASYFDPLAAPAESDQAGGTDFLTWLASWLDLTLDNHWPEEKRRRLLQHAHRLYALRGTPEGLRLHIRLYADAEPQILEHFKLRRWLYVDHARLGDASVAWGKAIVSRLQLDEYDQIGTFQLIDSGDPLHDPFHHHAHRFTVFVPLGKIAHEVQVQTLKRIVEMAKPAHTQGCLQLVEPRFRVGIQSFVGVDTVIGSYPDGVITREGQLGYDTLLGDSPEENKSPTMRVGMQSRIGSDTRID
jgi:phage tail-like protein